MDNVEKKEYAKFVQNYPAFLFLLMMCLIGVIGNLTTIFVYYFRYKNVIINYRIFIIALGIVDLFGCSIPLPFYAYRIRFSYTYNANIVCRLVFLNYALSLASGSLLTLIAADRYRKIYQPLKRQLEQRNAVLCSLLSIFLSVILSSLCFLFYGPVQELSKENDYNRTICTAYVEYRHSEGLSAYNGVVIIYGTILLIICVFVYTILLKLLRRFKHLDDIGKTHNLQEKESTETVIDEHMEYGSGNNPHMSRSPRNITVSTQTLYNDPEYKKKMSRYNRALTLTLVFIVATAISYTGCIVSFVFFMFSKNVEMNKHMMANLGAGYEILSNFHFVIHASNPIVYCFMDQKFRRKCASFYAYCCCCVCFKKQK